MLEANLENSLNTTKKSSEIDEPFTKSSTIKLEKSKSTTIKNSFRLFPNKSISKICFLKVYPYFYSDRKKLKNIDRTKELYIDHLEKEFEVSRETLTHLIDSFAVRGKELHYLNKPTIIDNSKESFVSFAFRRLISEKRDFKNFTRSLLVEVLEIIKELNRVDEVRYESDLFADKPYTEIDLETKILTYITNNLNIKKFATDIDSSIKNIIVDDYKQHFPKLDQFLKFFMSMRFTNDRKNGFLWLKAPSDWGKSFLSSILKDIGSSILVDYSDLMNLDRSPLNPSSIRNSFIFTIDEFKVFTADMKRFTHEIGIAPKHGMREFSPLYGKLLLSAENSNSFTGAVDEQISNRVSVMDMSLNDFTPLPKREAFREYNSYYYDVIKEYIVNKFIEYKDEFIKLSKYRAIEKANQFLMDFRENHKLKVSETAFDSAVDTVKSTLIEVIEAKRDNSILNTPNHLKEICDKVLVLDDKIILKAPRKAIETIFKVSLSTAELKKLQYKIDDVKEELGEYKAYFHNSKTVKGIKIPISSLYPPVDEPKEIESPPEEKLIELLTSKTEPQYLPENCLGIGSESKEPIFKTFINKGKVDHTVILDMEFYFNQLDYSVDNTEKLYSEMINEDFETLHHLGIMNIRYGVLLYRLLVNKNSSISKIESFYSRIFGDIESYKSINNQQIRGYRVI